MIDSFSLRRGNFIHDEAFGPVKVIGFGGGYVHTEKVIAGDYQFEPIPISAAWLERLGFHYDTITYNAGIIMIVPDSGAEWAAWLSSLTYGKICNVSYIHQLQNLFYAIEGKELVASEPKVYTRDWDEPPIGAPVH